MGHNLEYRSGGTGEKVGGGGGEVEGDEKGRGWGCERGRRKEEEEKKVRWRKSR